MLIWLVWFYLFVLLVFCLFVYLVWPYSRFLIWPFYQLTCINFHWNFTVTNFVDSKFHYIPHSNHLYKWIQIGHSCKGHPKCSYFSLYLCTDISCIFFWHLKNDELQFSWFYYLKLLQILVLASYEFLPIQYLFKASIENNRANL